MKTFRSRLPLLAMPHRLFVDERAATAAIMIVLMPLLLGFVGLVVDAGVLFAERTEMQKAVDAAAIAGAYDYGITSGGGCSQTNNVADAQAYFDDNHMSTFTFADADRHVETTTITHNGPPSSPPNLGGGIYCFWQVSAQREGIPLVFAPLVGGSRYSTVAATAVAYKSPVKGISNPLPYMAWGGNSDIECPTICPDPTDTGEPYDVGQVNSNGTVTFDSTSGLNVEGTPGVYNIELMSNNFVRDVVYPAPPCGSGGQPPC